MAHSGPVRKLADIVDFQATALITMECQRGVIGDLATFPALRRSVESTGIIPTMARLAVAARTNDIPVVHALAHYRRDRLGSMSNAPLLAYAATIDNQLTEGSPSAELVAELGPHPSDISSARRHGVSPFTGTDLDSILRSRRIETIVAVGVSLNVGIVGLCIEAVNLGYRVVVPADAVAAVPARAAESMLTNTIAQLALITDVDSIIAAWKQD